MYSGKEMPFDFCSYSAPANLSEQACSMQTSLAPRHLNIRTHLKTNRAVRVGRVTFNRWQKPEGNAARNPLKHRQKSLSGNSYTAFLSIKDSPFLTHTKETDGGIFDAHLDHKNDIVTCEDVILKKCFEVLAIIPVMAPFFR